MKKLVSLFLTLVLVLTMSAAVAEVTYPLTTEPVLELVFAIVLPAFSAAIFFNMGASGGGTDIVAMILKKYTRLYGEDDGAVREKAFLKERI